MRGLFTPFEELNLVGMSFLVVDESLSTSGKDAFTVVAELRVDYYLKGDSVPILDAETLRVRAQG